MEADSSLRNIVFDKNRTVDMSKKPIIVKSDCFIELLLTWKRAVFGFMILQAICASNRLNQTLKS
jgi:hypothetical protein